MDFRSCLRILETFKFILFLTANLKSLTVLKVGNKGICLNSLPFTALLVLLYLGHGDELGVRLILLAHVGQAAED